MPGLFLEIESNFFACWPQTAILPFLPPKQLTTTVSLPLVLTYQFISFFYLLNQTYVYIDTHIHICINSFSYLPINSCVYMH
jgi:hypothetical protein